LLSIDTERIRKETMKRSGIIEKAIIREEENDMKR